MPAHNVLIPLDGSTFSQQILPKVLRFLKSQDHHLILMRVAPPPVGVGGTPPRMLAFEGGAAFMPNYASSSALEQNKHPIYKTQAWESLKAHFSQELSRDAKDLQAAGFEVSLLVHFGEAAEEIIRAAQQCGVDLIVIVTHGRTGVKRMLLGSVAEKVLQQVRVPVLMLRPEGKETPGSSSTLSNVLIPLDETAFSRGVLGPVVELLQPSEHHLTLLRVAAAPKGEDPLSPRASIPGVWQDTNHTLAEETHLRLEQERTSYYTRLFEDRKDELLSELEDAWAFLTDAGFVVECAVRFGHAPEIISEFATFNDVTLIVMATHSRAGLKRLALGSVTKEVFNRTHLPILMVRPDLGVANET